MAKFDFAGLARVNADARLCSAQIREQLTHFQVTEQLPFTPDGVGSHSWLNIEKRGVNTIFLAEQLAKFAGVKPVAVGYAGLKDRHAVTRQWFSINLTGLAEPDWSQFANDNITIIEQTRHRNKLKRGTLTGNHFSLRLVNLQGDKALWLQNLKQVQQCGVSNYFAEQRFGRQMGNLPGVEQWFATGKAPRKRSQKSLYLSAARSWLFNLVIAERIKRGNWNQAVAGDIMLLAGTKASLFPVTTVSEDITTRLRENDIHPTGPLWGTGQLATQFASLDIEQQVLADWGAWQTGLEAAKMKQQRRALRLLVENLRWQFLADNQLELRFFLAAGGYATAVLREIADCANVQQRYG